MSRMFKILGCAVCAPLFTGCPGTSPSTSTDGASDESSSGGAASSSSSGAPTGSDAASETDDASTGSTSAAAVTTGDGSTTSSTTGDGTDESGTTHASTGTTGEGTTADADCGNGAVDADEQCDDGNDVDDDECSDECVWARRIFVTSQLFDGDLGGLAGADAKCEAAASEAGLTREGTTWVAWLSDANEAAGSRIGPAFTGWYVRLSEPPTAVAEGTAKFMSNDHLRPIMFDEHGQSMMDTIFVWTNTYPDGTPVQADKSCMSWTTDSGVSGKAGEKTQLDAGWSFKGDEHPCSFDLPLYCDERGL